MTRPATEPTPLREARRLTRIHRCAAVAGVLVAAAVSYAWYEVSQHERVTRLERTVQTINTDACTAVGLNSPACRRQTCERLHAVVEPSQIARIERGAAWEILGCPRP